MGSPRVDRIIATLAVVQWLIRIGGKCSHRECIRTVSGVNVCIVCNEEVTRAHS